MNLGFGQDADNGKVPFPLDPHGLIPNIGLTKRELFAAMAMQGLVSRYPTDYNWPIPSVISEYSKNIADSLIEELAK